jgi:hypothetical protein
MLDITLRYNDLDELPNVRTSNVEAFAISLEGVLGLGNFSVPPFMDKPRAIHVHGTDADSERVPVMLEELCSSWNQLRLLECDLPAIPLSSLHRVERG